MTSDELTEFAKRFAKAWCSHNPDRVAAFYAKNATISVNGGPPAPIADEARAFMRAFPDMIVTFDKHGLIAESSGHFDAADYEKQLKRAPEL